MFGYVIPVKDEMGTEEFEQFRSAYCGLCHSLREDYGFFATFILNYDFTFLALLLSAGEQEVSYCQRRCIASPFCPKRCCIGGKVFHRAAGYSLILAWWKLRDGVLDSGFFKGICYRGASLFLYRAYRRAKREFGDFDRYCKDRLEELHTLESLEIDSLDRTADRFAEIMRSAAEAAQTDDEKRILEQLLYHTGRWIYLIDAYDDLQEDKQSGNYNPILRRFSPDGDELEDEDKTYLRTTLIHSSNMVASAYNLLPDGAWSSILQNIVYLGLPAVTDSVLTHRWRQRPGGNREK